MGGDAGAVSPAPMIRVILLLALPCAAAATPVDDAIGLYRSKKYSEALAALEKIVAGGPADATACHALGMTLRQPGDTAALETALPWLRKAAELAPANADYLADYGGASLQVAAAKRSFLAATRGRDALEKALRLDPDDVDTHEALFEFYTQAPWPLGSAARAAAHLKEIGKADAVRAVALQARLQADEGNYPAAFRLCEGLLAQQPARYHALYEFGRTAALSGQNLERGSRCLREALALPRPSPASPSTAEVWRQIGVIEEKLGHRDQARAAYAALLALEPADAPAATALRRLSPEMPVSR